MRTLLSLPLPSSPGALTPTTKPACSVISHIDSGAPMAADCNLPELLVRDLEASEALFASKDMTAGCPSADFATPVASSGTRPDGDEGRQHRVKGGSLDSPSVMSISMEPPSIRTRRKSVATACTSGSGRCSSLFSGNVMSLTPLVLSPCTSDRDSSPQGTWYDRKENPR